MSYSVTYLFPFKSRTNFQLTKAVPKYAQSSKFLKKELNSENDRSVSKKENMNDIYITNQSAINKKNRIDVGSQRKVISLGPCYGQRGGLCARQKNKRDRFCLLSRTCEMICLIVIIYQKVHVCVCVCVCVCVLSAITEIALSIFQ